MLQDALVQEIVIDHEHAAEGERHQKAADHFGPDGSGEEYARVAGGEHHQRNDHVPPATGTIFLGEGTGRENKVYSLKHIDAKLRLTDCICCWWPVLPSPMGP